METILIEIRRQACYYSRTHRVQLLIALQIHGRTRTQEAAAASGGYQLLDGHYALLVSQLLMKMNTSLGTTYPTNDMTFNMIRSSVLYFYWHSIGAWRIKRTLSIYISQLYVHVSVYDR